MKNRIIRERYTALSALSGRSLPGKTAINKVVFLLGRFERPYQNTEKGQKQVWNDHQLPEGHSTDMRLPIALAEERTRVLDAYMDESQPIKKIPEHMRLTIDDMPKVLEGELGKRNVEGLANIRHMLGTLYRATGDENVKDETEGEEPDEAEVAPKDDFAPASAE